VIPHIEVQTENQFKSLSRKQTSRSVSTNAAGKRNTRRLAERP